MDVLVGVDLGTYSTKCVAISSQGELVAQASVPHELAVPQPGYAEQDAEAVWWQGLARGVRQLFAAGRFRPEWVRAVGVSTTAPCVLPLDDEDRPLAPAILYGIDVRAQAQVRRLEAELQEAFLQEHCGQRLSSQAAGPKMLWVREVTPEVFARTRRMVGGTTYLVHRLTGRWWLDQYTAPGYAPFFDIPTATWNRELIERYLGPGLRWPDIGWSTDVAGEVQAEAAAATGLARGTPVIVGTADAMAEAVSAAAVTPRHLFVMYGSSIFFIATLTAPLRSPVFWIGPGLRSGTWALAGGMSTAGSLVKWCAQVQRHAGNDEDLFAEAAHSPPGSHGLLLLPYFSGERTPILDPEARGAILGLSLSTTRGDLLRAALEGVAFGVRHNVEAIEQETGKLGSIVGAGGGVMGSLWPKIVSDVLGRAQRLMPGTSAAVGDALLAGAGVSLYPPSSLNDLAVRLARPRWVEPDPRVRDLYDQRYAMFRDLYAVTRPLAHQLSRS